MNTTEELKDRRDGIELAMLFQGNSPQGQAVLTCLLEQVQDAFLNMLDPTLDEKQVFYHRTKAVSLLQAMDRMGIKMQKAREMTVKRVAKQMVKQSLDVELGEETE